MKDHIVGMMWNKNEGDILTEIISDALRHVDTLMIADDGSTDNSWDIIQGFAAHHKDQIEHIQQAPEKRDRGQRRSMLNRIQERYRPEDTWVQIVESDIMILETDLERVLNERSNDVSLEWILLNAVIPPDKNWSDMDEYPNWSKSIQDIMTYGHRMETMPYTFRPFKELMYSNKRWRPWPQGFSKTTDKEKTREMTDYTPLLAHYGYRGPTHMCKKHAGKLIPKYAQWDTSTIETTKATLSMFDAKLVKKYSHPLTRSGWMNSKGKRGIHQNKVWVETIEAWRSPQQEGYTPIEWLDKRIEEHEKEMMTKEKKIPNLNTLADVIDRLIVEVNKLSFFENKKREEHTKDSPNTKLIAHWDNLSRDCCEYRSMLKNEINRLLSEIASTGEYRTLREMRTFRLPTRPVSEIIAERCLLAGSEEFKEELRDAFKEYL